MSSDSTSMDIDPRNGFCKSNSVFYSKRKPVALPCNESLDITTFISSRAHNGKIAYIEASTGRHLTFLELWRAVDSVASCLSEMGVRKDHVVLLFSPNSIFFPIICLSVMSLGAIITTTNPLNTPQEIRKQMADSKPILVFTTQSLLPKLSGTGLSVVIIGQQDNLSTKHSKIVSSLEDMMKNQSSRLGTQVKERIKQDDTATLLYSSGTTGASKGVVSSHRNLIALVLYVAVAKSFQSKFKSIGFMTKVHTLVNRVSLHNGEQTFICTVPMFHIYGLVAFALVSVASGSTVVVLSKFEMDGMLSAITKYRVTCLPLVPPILMGLVNHAETVKVKYDLRTLQAVLCGGAL